MRAATFDTLIEITNLNGLDPKACLRHVVTHVTDHLAKRLADLLLWNWTPAPNIAQNLTVMILLERLRGKLELQC